MSNNESYYKDNLVFEPSMPRCDIEDLKKQLETANFYLNQNAEYIQRLEDENKNLRQLLRECQKYFKYMTSADMPLDTSFDYMDVKLLDSINAAIGESEE